LKKAATARNEKKNYVTFQHEKLLILEKLGIRQPGTRPHGGGRRKRRAAGGDWSLEASGTLRGRGRQEAAPLRAVD